MAPGKFIGLLFGIAGAALAGVFASNAIVDPFDAMLFVSIPRLNQNKYVEATRLNKSIAVSMGRYQGVILGSSRAQVGLDPLHPAFGGRRIYNLGVSAPGINEIYASFSYARARNRLEIVVAALDFFMLTDKRTALGGKAFYNPRREGAPAWINLTLTWEALSRSIDTVLGNARGVPPAIIRGFVPLTDPTVERSLLGRSRQQGTLPLFRDVLRRDFFGAGRLYTTFAYDRGKLRLVRKMIERCRDSGVRLEILISPVHGLEIEAIRAAGLWPTFELWKRDLASLAGDGVRIFDFSGYEGPVAEPLAEPGTEMSGYYEPTHYSPALGNRVIERLFADQAESAPGAAGFGVLLDQDTIDAHLASIAAARDGFAARFEGVIAEIESLARSSRR